MARLSPTIVKQVIDVLRSQNKKVTNRNIVDYLGYGSFSTLKKIREDYPEFFSSGDTSSKVDTHQIDFTFKDDFIEKRVSSLEVSIQLMQQSIQQLIHNKLVSSDLEKQVKELTESLQEMYQLWKELAEKVIPITVVEQSVDKPSIDLTTTQPMDIPDPKEGPIFLAWAEQQKELNNGTWKPIVEQLNQQQVFMPKGGIWTTKSLSDFIRKKRQQFLRRS